MNQAKAKLKSGEPVIGAFVTIPSPGLTELIGLSGFDFVVIDMEHGAVNTGIAEDMVRAAEITGTTPMIRVGNSMPHSILQALDVGGLGVHIPAVSKPEDAELAIRHARYGPLGDRGLANVRAARYGLRESLSEYCSVANQQVMIVAQIEDLCGVENLDALLGVEGIDVYYVGPVDLSNSMGIPGQTKDPKMTALIADVIGRIAAAGKVAGSIAADAAVAQDLMALGARYIALHPLRLMVESSRQTIKQLCQ